MPASSAYLVVFVASACTLVIELVAGRILAPFIGVSLYTWTSIIGVCLAGISLGNYTGGRIADRWPDKRTLGILLALGGLTSLAILPLINIATAVPTGQLIDAADRLGGGLRIDRAAILIARILVITAVIFFLPTFVLGMVSPVVIKLSLRDLEHSGGLVGKVYAISTAGSILGTFATGFVLVQLMGTRMIVLSVAVVLLLLAVAFGGLLQARKAAAPLAAVLVLLAVLFPARNVFAYSCTTSDEPLGECLGRSVRDGWTGAFSSGCLRETSYFCIKVADTTTFTGQPVRELILDHLIHSYNSLDDPNYLYYGYIKVYAEVANVLATRLPDRDLHTLNIGGGGYTLPRHLESTYPNSQTTVMEIDPGVTRTVYEQLGVDRNTTEIVTYNVDARLMMDQLLRTESGTYDLVIGDAFNDLSIPYHLTTQEFSMKAKRLLKDDGVFLVLVIDKLNGGRFMPAYVKTIQTVFPSVQVMADGELWNATTANTFVVAASNHPIDPAVLAQARGQGLNGQVVTRIMPADRMDAWLAASDAPILTDDYAPVDNLIAPIFAERGF